MDETPEKPLPGGDYAILELFGHTTLVGRIGEVERYGAKMLVIEPLFRDELLAPVFHGGASIYRLTPCSLEVARAKQPRYDYQLPPPVLAIVPPLLIAQSRTAQLIEERADAFDNDGDERLF